jgi:hypothetical protein
MSEQQIQFIANLDNFVSVKKLKIEKQVTNQDIIEFLASIQFSCNQKITDYLEKIIDSKKLLEETKDLFNLGVEDFYNQINTAKLKKIITNAFSIDLDKKQKEAYVGAVKVYLLNKYCLDKNITLGYNHVVFPSKKRIMKLKKK